jgi:hypothetical protein
VTEEELAAIVRNRIAEAHAWLNNPALDRPDVTAKIWIERYAADGATLLDELNRLRKRDATMLATMNRQGADDRALLEQVAAMRPIVEAVAFASVQPSATYRGDIHIEIEILKTIQDQARALLAKE